MKKARITTPEEMRLQQEQEDRSMTPQQRLELAFKISDFAAEIGKDHPQPPEESSPIRWIILHEKRSASE